MRIQLVQSRDAFQALRPEWNEILSRSSADTIFLTWEWLFSWWESYAGRDDVLQILTVRDDENSLVGILPFYRKLEPCLPLRAVRTMHLIGDTSYDSDYLDAILTKGREEEILNAVWKHLGSERPAWNLLQLAGIPENSPTLGWLKRVSVERHLLSRSSPVECLVTDLPDSWDAFMATLQPRFRTKIRSTLRDLSTRQLRFYSIEKFEDLGGALQTLYQLHGKRWALRGTDGVFGNPQKRKFYERFTRLFLERGWLAFDFIDLNGQPVACQMCFRYGSTQYLLQEGFDPEFASESVGVGLRALAFQRAIEHGIKHYDFLAGVGRHKTQWQARLKQCHNVSLAPRTVQNTIHLKLPIWKDALREHVKAMLPVKVLEIRRKLAAS